MMVEEGKGMLHAAGGKVFVHKPQAAVGELL